MRKKQSAETLVLRSKTDQELIELRQSFSREFQKHASAATKISQTLSRIKNELRRRRSDNDKPFVSDHATLRYLSRVNGIDIEAIRHEIAMKVPSDIKDIKDRKFIKDGVTYLISQDGKCVTTVVIEGEVDEDLDSSKEAKRGGSSETT